MVQRVCFVPPTPNRPVPEDASPERKEAIRLLEKKWVNGSVIKYHFLAEFAVSGSSERKAAFQDAVRKAWSDWTDLGLGLTLVETANKDEAQVRIGFLSGDGSWSYVGRDVLLETSSDRRTMNFGWDLTQPGDDTAIHEIGHTLGLQHEHQNPKSGIEWDAAAAYREFGGPPNNWDRATVDNNILRKLPIANVEGSDWDPKSVMHYPFPPGIIRAPEQYRANGIQPPGGMSEGDVQWVRTFFPPLDDGQAPLLKPRQAYFATVAAGKQVDLRVAPPDSKSYTFQTTGDADTVMVLFAAGSGGAGAGGQQLAADDDSGTSRNAMFTVPLDAGAEYLLRVRLYYSDAAAEVGVLYW